ncbi:MAG: hypothetical protein ACR2JB_01880 [Bryobacteraceae bacterium]
MRVHETFTLDCYACGAAVEMPANGDTYCPRCGTMLDVQWRGERVVTPRLECEDATSEIARAPSEEAQESVTADKPSDVPLRDGSSLPLGRLRSPIR